MLTNPIPPRSPGPARLVELDPDHPGFRDLSYRARRDEIAAASLAYVPGTPVADVQYTAEEEALWRRIWNDLTRLHEQHVARELIDLREACGSSSASIPQLERINATLATTTGFRMEPVAGLVSARDFLAALRAGVFLSTQYLRHPSRPLYTPEPDIVHEFVGHAATLASPEFAQLNRMLGEAAAGADDADLGRIERVYWFTLEFGVVLERGRPKAVGAGLLSSAGELLELEHGPALLPWDLDAIARKPYDPAAFQPELFVAPSLARLLGDLRAWLGEGRWRR